MLEVEGLRAGYGRIPILHGIDMTVGRGEAVGVLGHNGMGKTTLMKALIGLVRPTGGLVRLDGREITRAPPHRRQGMGVGYVPQGRQIYPALTVTDNLRMGCVTRRSEEAAILERIFEEFRG